MLVPGTDGQLGKTQTAHALQAGMDLSGGACSPTRLAKALGGARKEMGSETRLIQVLISAQKFPGLWQVISSLNLSFFFGGCFCTTYLTALSS